MLALQSLIFLGFPIVIAGSPTLVERAPTGTFGLFAYGDGIGGVSVFTAGDRAFLGNATEVGDDEAAPVEFELGTDNALLGSPNSTSTSNAPSWSNLTFVVPAADSSSHDVEFTSSTPGTNVSASGFTFYGQFLFHKKNDGNLESMWYALPSEQEGVWTLGWNTTGDDTEGKVLLSLRAVAPSKTTGSQQ
ncbi:hypothetical protein AAE478_001902 [Parahypoxylon ruwenzoriense]